MWVIIVLCLAYGLYNYIIKNTDANMKAKANAREMKKAFPSVGTLPSNTPQPGTLPSNTPQPEKTWRCAFCGHENSEKLTYCLLCHSDRNIIEKVTCPYCGAQNNKTNSTCFACRNSLKSKRKKEESIADNEYVTLIKQIAELHEKGILSDEEFETKKAELLAKM